MRVLLLLTGAFFFTALSVFSQNPLMKPFGTSYQEVEQFLQKRNCTLTYEEDLIVAKKGEISLEYLFRNDRLYQMSIEKQFDKKKASEEAMESFRAHYQLVGAEVVEMEQGKSASSFVALRGRDLNEVSCRRGDSKQMNLRLTSRNLDFYPDEHKAMLSEEIRSYSALAQR